MFTSYVEGVVLVGNLYDDVTKKPLNNIRVYDTLSHKVVFSDTNGRFGMETTRAAFLQFTSDSFVSNSSVIFDGNNIQRLGKKRLVGNFSLAKKLKKYFSTGSKLIRKYSSFYTTDVYLHRKVYRVDSIIGIVYDDVTKTPIKYMSVSVCMLRTKLGDKNYPYQTKTDSQGQFVMPCPHEDDFSQIVCLSSNGYEPTAYQLCSDSSIPYAITLEQWQNGLRSCSNYEFKKTINRNIEILHIHTYDPNKKRVETKLYCPKPILKVEKFIDKPKIDSSATDIVADKSRVGRNKDVESFGFFLSKPLSDKNKFRSKRGTNIKNCNQKSLSLGDDKHVTNTDDEMSIDTAQLNQMFRDVQQIKTACASLASDQSWFLKIGIGILGLIITIFGVIFRQYLLLLEELKNIAVQHTNLIAGDKDLEKQIQVAVSNSDLIVSMLKETQNRTNSEVSKLADSVAKLNESIIRLQEQLKK